MIRCGMQWRIPLLATKFASQPADRYYTATVKTRSNVSTVVPQFLRSRIGKICVAIIGDTAAEMLEKAASVVKENPFLEFRLDYIGNPLLALPKIKQFLAENTAATAIATCRRKENGGKFTGSIAAEV